MANAAIEPVLRGANSGNTRGLLRVTILGLIAAAAVASRLFSVISKITIPSPSFCIFMLYVELEVVCTETNRLCLIQDLRV